MFAIPSAQLSELKHPKNVQLEFPIKTRGKIDWKKVVLALISVDRQRRVHKSSSQFVGTRRISLGTAMETEHMFDPIRITDVVGDYFGQSSGSRDLSPDDLLTQLAVVGVDLRQIEGLGAPEVLEFLAQRGVDIASLEAGQITQLVDQLADGSSLECATHLLIAAADRH